MVTERLHKPNQITRRQALGLGTITALGLITSGCRNESHPTDKTEVENPSIERKLTPETQQMLEDEFLVAYEEFKEHYLLDAGDGALRTLHDPDVRNTSLELQSIGEFFTLFSGDYETAERMFRYDDRYQTSTGLKPWLIQENGEVEDDTVVSAVMMYLAQARLLSPEKKRHEEAKKMLEDIKNHTINPRTHIPQGFEGEWSLDLTNPSYWNPFHLEVFASHDSYWQEVSQETRSLMKSIDEQIDAGELAYFPNWVDMDGKPRLGPEDDQPVINYDAVYIPIQQLQGAMCCQDSGARRDAEKQLAYANRFFYEKIAITDRGGKVVNYEIEKLKDGYNLDGTLRTDDDRWSLTAFASGAAVASIISDDPDYREYMVEQLIELPRLIYPFNDYIRTFALLTLSGRQP